MNPNRLPETHGNEVTSWIPLESGWTANSECVDLRWNYHSDIIAAWDPGYGLTGRQSGFEYSNQIQSQGATGQCTSRVAAGQDVTYMGRGENGAWTARSSRMNTATTVVGIQINGWKFADETAASTPSTESCSLLESSETAPANLCSESEAFGNSAKIGIGVGVSLGLTGLVALGAGLLMMYRARKAARSMPPRSSVTKDFSGDSGPLSSSHFSLSRTSEVQERNNPTQMPDFATEPSPQNWSGYPAEQYTTEQPLYHPYAVTVPHGEMEGTAGPIPQERPHTRMELEGEFERNIKVLFRPQR
ncbi:hypothetical protein DL769_001484 [Monosporascus sp. CRB-8-3]|nr:hypothetical protein DL769_001484 [Monosporascus sp. CRB-8-3]